MHAIVVISGFPASGKTTLASALASRLRFPLLDKDAFLEALFQLEGTGNAEWRRSLSSRADAQFREAVLLAKQSVATSWWKHPLSKEDSGTPIDWLSLESQALVEVHCSCRASVAAARFLARNLHPGHLDKLRSSEGLLAMLEQQEAFGPLFPSKAIVVNTEEPVELSALAVLVNSALETSVTPNPGEPHDPPCSTPHK